MMVLNSRVLMKYNGQIILKPLDRSCVPNEMGRMLVGAAPDKVKWSTFDSWEKRYSGQDLNGKSICIMRYAGIGDLLHITALTRYLRHLYPTAMIHFYTLGPHYSSTAFYGNPDVDGCAAFPLPIPLDAAKQYDYHIFIDGVMEHNSEYDQGNWYDILYSFCGLKNVPAEFKRPELRPMAQDWKWIEDSHIDLSSPYVMFQTRSSSPIRDYADDLGAKCVDELLKRLPAHRVAITGECDLPAYHRFKDNPRVIWACGVTQNWRQIIPLVYNADCVVCSDTGMGHVAAAYPHVPVVSLWGAFNYECRAKYYANHTPIEHVGTCPHQPCYTHGNTLPVAKCRASRGWKEGQVNCSAMLDITPVEIAEAVARRVIAGKPRHVGLMTVDAFKAAFGWAEASVPDKKYGSDLDRNVIQTLAVWRKPESVVEIGINEGRQAELILKALPCVKEYVGVDVPADAKTPLPGQQSEVPAQPGHMVRDDRLKVIVRPRGAYDCKPDELPAADFWYIDGDHSAAAVEHDTLQAFLRAKPGAVIVWHDFWNPYDRKIGVAEVLTRLAPTLPLKIRHVLGSAVAFAVKE